MQCSARQCSAIHGLNLILLLIRAREASLSLSADRAILAIPTGNPRFGGKIFGLCVEDGPSTGVGTLEQKPSFCSVVSLDTLVECPQSRQPRHASDPMVHHREARMVALESLQGELSYPEPRAHNLPSVALQKTSPVRFASPFSSPRVRIARRWTERGQMACRFSTGNQLQIRCEANLQRTAWGSLGPRMSSHRDGSLARRTFHAEDLSNASSRRSRFSLAIPSLNSDDLPSRWCRSTRRSARQSCWPRECLSATGTCGDRLIEARDSRPLQILLFRAPRFEEAEGHPDGIVGDGADKEWQGSSCFARTRLRPRWVLPRRSIQKRIGGGTL